MTKKVFISGLAIISLLGVLFYLYLFRSEVTDNPTIGITTYHYRWGRPARITVDSNRDGKTDFLGEIEAPFGAYASHTAEMFEYWEDKNHDGHFELHVFVENTGPFTKPKIRKLEIDNDGDGKYERQLIDEKAIEYYRKLSAQDKKSNSQSKTIDGNSLRQ